MVKKSSFKVLILTFNFRFYHIWRALDNFCQRILCLSVWELCHIMWHLNGVMWRYPCCNMTFFNKIPSKKTVTHTSCCFHFTYIFIEEWERERENLLCISFYCKYLLNIYFPSSKCMATSTNDNVFNLSESFA